MDIFLREADDRYTVSKARLLNDRKPPENISLSTCMIFKFVPNLLLDEENTRSIAKHARCSVSSSYAVGVMFRASQENICSSKLLFSDAALEIIYINGMKVVPSVAQMPFAVTKRKVWLKTSNMNEKQN